MGPAQGLRARISIYPERGIPALSRPKKALSVRRIGALALESRGKGCPKSRQTTKNNKPPPPLFLPNLGKMFGVTEFFFFGS